MQRDVQPEILDDLLPGDALAVGSRADLRRLNAIMGHEALLWAAMRRHLDFATLSSRPLRIVELGAGDGTLLLRVARRCAASGVIAHVILLDRQDLVSAATHRAFAALKWSVEGVTTDILSWLERDVPPVDVMLANLLLHHFPDLELARLLEMAASKTRLFIACEPRRSARALMVSRWLGLIGCNAVTRHDAVVSVRAGFSGYDLTALWPADPAWLVHEQAAGLFSHCFTAQRHG